MARGQHWRHKAIVIATVVGAVVVAVLLDTGCGALGESLTPHKMEL